MTKLEVARTLAEIATRIATETAELARDVETGRNTATRSNNIMLNIEMFRAGLLALRND